MQRRSRWVLGAALVSVVAGVVGMRLLRTDEAGEAWEGPRYKEVSALRGVFRVAVSANGLVRPINRIELKSKASGKVIELPIEVGDRVEKSGLIAKLDQVEERAALAQARADLEIARAELGLAQKNFARRKQLFGSNVISEEVQDQTELDLAVARSKLVQATTALERARERMEDTVIAAPVAGIILQKYVERGQIIASGLSNVGGGTPIADIAAMHNVYIEAGIDEIDIGKMQVGQRATIRAEAHPDQVYEGEIVRIAPEARVEQNVTLFDVVVEVANSDRNLKSGMNATVEIVIFDQPDLLTIPVAALQKSGAEGPGSGPREAVVLVKNRESFEPRTIRTGRTDQRIVEVLEGLSEGEILGIPMLSRLKEEHDLLDARVRRSRSFRGNPAKNRKPAGGHP